MNIIAKFVAKQRGGFVFSFVNAMLTDWGEWMERVMDDNFERDGASVNVGGGHAQMGHQILCAEVPRKVWITGYHVTHLPEPQQEAVTAWYVFHVKPTGEMWKPEEKAQQLGIAYDTLRQRLARARTTLYPKLMAA